MNEKVKSFFKKFGGIIAGFFGALLAIICGAKIRTHRGRADDIRDELGDASSANRDAKDTTEDIKREAESIEHTTNNIEQCNRECSEVIANIRRRGKK